MKTIYYKKKIDKLNIISDKNIRDYINVINTDHIYIAEKVDYYRGKLLYTYGGIWLDIDTILINNILLNYDKED